MADHEIIKRPRVVVEPLDPENPHAMYRARCEHCPWVCGPTAKSWADGTEARLHRVAHRAGTAPVCDIAVVLTESGQDWKWTCACGATTEQGWHGSPFDLAAIEAVLDAIANGHRGSVTMPEGFPLAIAWTIDRYVDAARADLERAYLVARRVA